MFRRAAGEQGAADVADAGEGHSPSPAGPPRWRSRRRGSVAARRARPPDVGGRRQWHAPRRCVRPRARPRAASGPWPRPSATSTDHRSAWRAQAQASPQTVSPCIATETPATTATACRARGAGRSRASTAVPAPGAEKISHRSAIRSHCAQPAPAGPAGGVAVAQGLLDVAMPGPRSIATISIAAPALGSGRTSSSPPPPWRRGWWPARWRRARPCRVALARRPAAPASATAARRAAPTWVASCTGSARLAFASCVISTA